MNQANELAAFCALPQRPYSFFNHVMKHLALSPDMVPSDFHLFGPLKEVIGGKRF
jgi:hypothetical protein